MQKPSVKPNNPKFSSGPCAKRPGWSADAIADGWYGDTGAVEIAMWNLLGARGVDMLGWESFGIDWIKDAVDQLKLDDCRTIQADYGKLPDLSEVDTDRDVVFTWNGTTSGVRVPNADWIKDDRKGLTICDATSVLSPRAAERLQTFRPNRPLPKIFRLTKGDKIIEGAYQGATLNTPSMMAAEDCLDALKWVESIGGLETTIQRSADSYKAVADWVEKTDWIEFLAEEKGTESFTSICLKITDPWFQEKSEEERPMMSQN